MTTLKQLRACQASEFHENLYNQCFLGLEHADHENLMQLDPKLQFYKNTSQRKDFNKQLVNTLNPNRPTFNYKSPVMTKELFKKYLNELEHDKTFILQEPLNRILVKFDERKYEILNESVYEVFEGKEEYFLQSCNVSNRREYFTFGVSVNNIPRFLSKLDAEMLVCEGEVLMEQKIKRFKHVDGNFEFHVIKNRVLEESPKKTQVKTVYHSFELDCIINDYVLDKILGGRSKTYEFLDEMLDIYEKIDIMKSEKFAQ